ncbi:serine/threonine-protein kinase HipA [Trinickia symbiotica]|nr:serine/threonine-protein kinase HipA [Trinickia symbiotica]
MLPSEEEPEEVRTIQGRALTESDIAHLLRDTTAAPIPGAHEFVDDLRLSIAGAQEKTALLWHQGRWLLPVGSTPTTHILKLPLGLVGNMQADMRTSVENEWLCSKIVAAYGLPIARCEIQRFEDQKVLVVERFDRRLSTDKTWFLRLPQEDMCQATGTSANRKYESEGGPGIDKIMAVLSGSDRAAVDTRNFYQAQLVFWLLAAIDGHAKNFSIALLAGDRYYRATPLYDVLSAHPIIGKGKNQLPPQRARLAMAVRSKNSHYAIEQIQRRHWLAQGERVGFAAKEVEDMMAMLHARTESVIDEVAALLPREFPMDVADTIFAGMRRQCQMFVAA